MNSKQLNELKKETKLTKKDKLKLLSIIHSTRKLTPKEKIELNQKVRYADR